ncbi:MAG TPA: AAA family ATPase [Candidatus Microsaccharimonas sp.]|jgi:shikimate kinase
MNKLIILRGYPGSGKTTIGKALAEENVGVFVDHNSILTFIAKITEEDDGIYEDIARLELAITKKLLNDGKTAIVGRGFSSIDSLSPYISLANSLNIRYQILRLDVEENLLMNRVQSPERQNDFNPTTSSESLKLWIQSNGIEDIDRELIIDNSKALVAVIDTIKNAIKL